MNNPPLYLVLKTFSTLAACDKDSISKWGFSVDNFFWKWQIIKDPWSTGAPTYPKGLDKGQVCIRRTYQLPNSRDRVSWLFSYHQRLLQTFPQMSSLHLSQTRHFLGWDLNFNTRYPLDLHSKKKLSVWNNCIWNLQITFKYESHVRAGGWSFKSDSVESSLTMDNLP